MAESYRSVMEVLKWVEPKQTLSNAVALNKCFQRVCDSDELWHSYIDLEGLDSSQLEEIPSNMKEGFKLLYRNTMKWQIALYSEPRDLLYVFNCKRETLIKTCSTECLQISNFSALVFISPKELFLCGGCTERRKAFKFHIATLRVRKLPDMRHPRSAHAVIFRNRQVYTFGGVQSSNTAEKFSMLDQNWTTLPNMVTGHSYFNVCSQDNLIYICGGHTHKCETFNCETEQFNLLTWTIKFQGCNTAFLYEDQVFCAADNKLWYVNSKERRHVTGNFSS